MNLSELQTEFLSLSGRLDLSSADQIKFINQGIKLLDEISGFIDIPKHHFANLAEGDNTLVLPSTARNIQAVYLVTETTRTRLVRASHDELREIYNTYPATADRSFPQYYTPISILLAAHPTADTLSYFSHWSNFKVDNGFDVDGLLLYPLPNEACKVEILGNFYSPKLVGREDSNYWSVKHPDLTAQAAIFKLDMGYRNTMGASDILQGIKLELQELYLDRIELELSDKNLILEG